MERSYTIGQHVLYTDHYGVEHSALLTNLFLGHKDGPEGYLKQYGEPSVNVVYVVKDDGRRDQYGNQTEHDTSVVHKSEQSAPGNFWRWPDES